MNKRLLLFNLAMDENNSALNFTVNWVNALAERFDHIDVVTMQKGDPQVAPNVTVYSIGKERGYSEPRRALVFYKILLGLLIKHRYVACFAHMMPLFVVMGAPFLKVWRIPVTLWYAHPARHRQVEWGARLSRRVITSVTDSFPIPVPHLRVIGQGINTDFWTLADPASETDSILYVSRLMPIKHQMTLIRAFAKDPKGKVILIGDPMGAVEYRQSLEDMAHALDIYELVEFTGAKPPAQIRDDLHTALLAVNLTPQGSFDKTGLESMACGIPTIVANPSYEAVLGEYREQLLIDDSDDIEGLAERIEYLRSLTTEERRAIGLRQRELVIQYHSFKQLINRIEDIILTGETTR